MALIQERAWFNLNLFTFKKWTSFIEAQKWLTHTFGFVGLRYLSSASPTAVVIAKSVNRGNKRCRKIRC